MSTANQLLVAACASGISCLDERSLLSIIAQAANASAAAGGDPLKVAKAGDTMTGALLLPAGTAALPALAFSASPTTGLFRVGTNIVGIATTGVERMRIDASGITTLTSATTPLKVLCSDAGVSTVNGCFISHSTSGVPVAGFGVRILLAGDDNGGGVGVVQSMARVETTWTDATHGTQTSNLNLWAVHSGSLVNHLTLHKRAILAIDNGTAALPVYTFGNDLTSGIYLPAAGTMALAGGGVERFKANATGIGFFAVTAVAQQASGANLTNSVTVGGTNDTIADFADLSVFANSAATIRNNIYQLSRKLKQVNDALRAYGLLT